MPEVMKPRARPVNPKLYEHAKKEFLRLMEYMYEKSSSDISSCLVIAPKATAPFIRFCGDYVGINRFIVIGHYPIPHVQRQLEKIMKFCIFLDFDLANAFHQIRLAAITSKCLSIQTPWVRFNRSSCQKGLDQLQVSCRRLSLRSLQILRIGQ